MGEVKIKVLCPRCEGQKQIQMEKYPHGQGMARVFCPECHGKGWIKAVFITDTSGRVEGFR